MTGEAMTDERDARPGSSPSGRIATASSTSSPPGFRVARGAVRGWRRAGTCRDEADYVVLAPVGAGRDRCGRRVVFALARRWTSPTTACSRISTTRSATWSSRAGTRTPLWMAFSGGLGELWVATPLFVIAGVVVGQLALAVVAARARRGQLRGGRARDPRAQGCWSDARDPAPRPTGSAIPGYFPSGHTATVGGLLRRHRLPADLRRATRRHGPTVRLVRRDRRRDGVRRHRGLARRARRLPLVRRRRRRAAARPGRAGARASPLAARTSSAGQARPSSR